MTSYRIFFTKIVIISAFFLVFIKNSAIAQTTYTQCSVNISSIYSGDGGYIWLAFSNGGSVEIPSSNPDQAKVLSLAETALAGQRPMVVRYSSANVDCTSQGRTDFQGAYLF